MPDNRILLFVYGTLKRGLENHHLLADQRFHGEAVTEPRYRLFDLGAYPALVHDEANGLSVAGELWAVTPGRLTELDAFEEVPDLFIRAAIHLQGHFARREGGREDGGPIYAYIYNRPVPRGTRSGDRWPLPGSAAM